LAGEGDTPPHTLPLDLGVFGASVLGPPTHSWLRLCHKIDYKSVVSSPMMIYDLSDNYHKVIVIYFVNPALAI